MFESVGRFLAVVGTPVAVIYALGLLVFVGDLRFVEPNRIGVLAAWNAAGLVDREVLLGAGVGFFIPALLLGVVVWLFFRYWPTWVPPLVVAYLILLVFPFLSVMVVVTVLVVAGVALEILLMRDILSRRQPQQSQIAVLRKKCRDLADTHKSKQKDRPSHEHWLLIVLFTFIIGVGLIYLWGFRSSGLGLRGDLPTVTVVIRPDTIEQSPSIAEGNEQTINAQVKPVGNGSGDEYVVTGAMEPSGGTTQTEQTGNTESPSSVTGESLSGQLLSHDSQFWYVIEDPEIGDDEKGLHIRIIPTDRVGEVRVKPQKDKPISPCDFKLLRQLLATCDRVGAGTA
jgi:hypothetical protein